CTIQGGYPRYWYFDVW
nr:immunoglobulin heavy chain junction region [Mus musculus]NSM07198.1 immunoglobulin heavy chain junction region [Mus musculus]NSM09558.1 immunoglobulin heavy chain junction region [Mus musculus]